MKTVAGKFLNIKKYINCENFPIYATCVKHYNVDVATGMKLSGPFLTSNHIHINCNNVATLTNSSMLLLDNTRVSRDGRN